MLARCGQRRPSPIAAPARSVWGPVFGLVIACVLSASGPAHATPGWTPSFAVGFDATAVAMSADGTTVYSGLAMVDGSQRAAVTVRPPGGPLGAIQALSPPGLSGVSRPAVAAGPDGRFMAAWPQAGVLETAVMMPGEQTFGDEVAILTPGEEASAGSVVVAVDGAGDGLVLWTTSKPGPSSSTVRTLRFGLRPATGVPSSQVLDQVSSSPSNIRDFHGLDMATSAAGAAIAGWQMAGFDSGGDGETHVLAALRAPGQPFGQHVVLESGSDNSGAPASSFADRPSVATSPSGEAAVVWGYRAYGSGNDVFRVRLRSGTPASGLAGVEEPSASAGTFPSDPDVAFAADGRALVAFRAHVAGIYRPQVAIRPAGGGSFIVQTVTTSGDAASKLALATSGSGQSLLLFTTYGPVAGGVQGAVAAPGALFGAPVPLASGLSSLNDLAVAATAAGDAVAIWRSYKSPAYTADAAGYDVSGPRLLDLQFPSTATAGTPLGFAVRPVDIWSPVASTAWTFGDGATVAGAGVTHTYAAAGARDVSVTSTDALGNASATMRTLTVAAAPAAGAGDRTAPVIEAFSLSPRAFAATRRPAGAARKVPRGTTFRLRLSEAADAVITITREIAGLRRGRRCASPTRALRRSILRAGGSVGLRLARCVRLARAGAIRRSVPAGRVSVPFDGWIDGRALRRGSYGASVTATDQAGNRASRAGPRFRIVAGR